MSLRRSPMPRPKNPLRRFKPLLPKKKLARTPLLRPGTSGVEESTGRDGTRGGRPSRGHRVPVDVSKLVEERSEGLCEIGLSFCRGRATQKHHRITQKIGGRKRAAASRSDRPSNLLHVCGPCHTAITDRCWVDKAHDPYNTGWSLRERQEPTQEPVLRRGELVYLDDVGGVWSYEEAGA